MSNSLHVKICKNCGCSYESRFCKPCKKDYLRNYRIANKQRIDEQILEWKKKNPDKRQSTLKKWRDSNPNRDKDYYKKNAEKIKQRTKVWYEANKERSTAYKLEYNKKNPEVRVTGKAKRRSAIGVYRLPYGTIPTIYAKQNGKCACCGQTLIKYHVDHIMPLCLGGKHIPENLQLLLPRCNLKKGKSHPDIWKSKIKETQSP